MSDQPTKMQRKGADGGGPSSHPQITPSGVPITVDDGVAVSHYTATVPWTTEREGGTLVSPKLGEVAGVRIVVWLKEEHGVPHIQTVGEQEFSLAIEDGRLLTPGRPDPRTLRHVARWLEANRAMAWAAWHAARRGKTFDPGTWR